MPSPESSSSGPNPIPNSGANSRKEKKKQAKEERDRLKQVEKKKRRLEKALATAAAIRIELEKKKQKRKEEEQRLDEEGAALAEAVALQVLVEEDTDVFESSAGTENGLCEERGGIVSLGYEVKSTDTGTCSSFGNSLRSPGQKFDLKQQICFTYLAAVAADDGEVASTSKSLYSNWEASMTHTFGHLNRDKPVKLEELQVEEVAATDSEIFSNPEDNLKASTERAKAAEVAAGMAAAQAVAALRIAEEARAEAEAAKKAAEAAISQVLDRKQLSNVDQVALQVNFQPRNVETERDELKARLEETKRQLKKKTRQVSHLEQNLEDMTQYLLQLKGTLPFVMSGGAEREGETSERDSTNVAESSGGTVDQ